MSTNYRPKLDVSKELFDQVTSYYQSLIGVLRLILALGWVDMYLETSRLASCVTLPREGYLDMVYRIFAYLKKYYNTKMIFNLSFPDINPQNFERKD